MKVTIECSEKELQLLNRALDLYSRIGILQFEKMTDVVSLQKLIWKEELIHQFDDRAKELKTLFGYTPNSGPGIFHLEKVSDDVREAAHMHQVIRHELWKQREEKSSYTVDAYPADICKIADIPIPIFEVKIESI